MRFLLGVCLLATSHACLAAGVAGIWHGLLEGQPFFLELRTDGSGTLDGDPIRYEQIGDQLRVEMDGRTVGYNFLLKDGQLQVSGGDLTARARSRAESAAAGVNSP